MNTAEIWKEFNDELLGFILSRVNQRDLAEDILQDVFVKIHKKADQLADNNKLESWIYQITRNSIIDHYRKKKIPTADGSLLNSLAIDENELSINHQFVKCLRPFVDQLPEIYRDAFNRTSYGELSQREYAETIGISYTAVKSRVQRARHKLRSLFTECCHVETDNYGNILSADRGDCSC